MLLLGVQALHVSWRQGSAWGPLTDHALPCRRAAEPRAGYAGSGAMRRGEPLRRCQAGRRSLLVGACVLAFVLRQRRWHLASNRRWHGAVAAGRCGAAVCFSLRVERERRGPAQLWHSLAVCMRPRRAGVLSGKASTCGTWKPGLLAAGLEGKEANVFLSTLQNFKACLKHYEADHQSACIIYH